LLGHPPQALLDVGRSSHNFFADQGKLRRAHLLFGL